MAAQTYLEYPRSPDHLPDGDPISRKEMAELTGRGIKAVYKWHERRTLPLADGPRVAGYPTWRRRTFFAWAYEQGFTRDAEGVPLPMHAEAADWHQRVEAESILPLRDVERREQRAG